jgi:hypothetical protein
VVEAAALVGDELDDGLELELEAVVLLDDELVEEELEDEVFEAAAVAFV